MIVAVVIASLLSVGASVNIASLVIQPEPGPRGPKGEAGTRGPQGLRSPVGQVDEGAVWEAIEADTARLQSNLDPNPADVQAALEDLELGLNDLATAVDSLCSELSYAPALENEYLSCP